VVSYDIPGQYVISIRLSVPTPLTAEPRDREGVATIMARTLDEGTASHDAAAFAELLERRGIAFGASVGDSGLGIDVDVPKRHLGAALDLLGQVLREPAFAVHEVERQVKTRLAEIDQERATPGQRAALEFVRTFYAADERASRPTGGSHETVSVITAADVQAYFRSTVGPSGATVVVAGDLDGLDVVAEVEQWLGSWDTPVEVAPEQHAARRAADAARIVLVDRPGSVQTELYVGCPGPDRHEPQGWAAYPVLSFVIGGAPNSRVDSVLREDKGFTYGIRSGFRPRNVGGLFLTSGAVRADSTVESVDLLMGILDGAREGYTEQEVRSGVDFIGLTAPGRYATADAVADEAATLAMEGLTTDFTSRNLAALASLDADALAAAYRRYVTGEWTVVLVGDASAYADGVRALDRGPVTIVPN